MICSADLVLEVNAQAMIRIGYKIILLIQSVSQMRLIELMQLKKLLALHNCIFKHSPLFGCCQGYPSQTAVKHHRTVVSYTQMLREHVQGIQLTQHVVFMPVVHMHAKYLDILTLQLTFSCHVDLLAKSVSNHILVCSLPASQNCC